jgi:hypothetical protein
MQHLITRGRRAPVPSRLIVMFRFAGIRYQLAHERRATTRLDAFVELNEQRCILWL